MVHLQLDMPPVYLGLRQTDKDLSIEESFEVHFEIVFEFNKNKLFFNFRKFRDVIGMKKSQSCTVCTRQDCTAVLPVVHSI